METGKSVARLRFVRDLLGRTASEGEGDAEGGFTLIELMVVLLIMGILLAIAIPTFLSVTGGAKKTAAQSNLTDAVTSATASYTNQDKFSSTTVTTLKSTQSSITFVTGTTGPTQGKNSISVDDVSTNILVLSALDSGKTCWVVAVNEGAATATVPRGNSFYGVATSTQAKCAAPTVYATIALGDWVKNFATLSSLKT